MTRRQTKLLAALQHGIALQKFGALVLNRLEHDQDWGSDTFDHIASYAVDLKLAQVGSNSMFKRILPRARK